MDPARWRQISDIFSEAVELPGDARPDFLDRVCRGDAQLRAEVNAMLAGHRENDRTIAEVVQGAAAGFALHQQQLETPSYIGRRIGPYQIVRQIGAGGMGTVYQAVRAADEYQRAVAIKLISQGAETPESHARFRTERQILATLQHPNIAALLDGGATGRGIPHSTRQTARRTWKNFRKPIAAQAT